MIDDFSEYSNGDIHVDDQSLFRNFYPEPNPNASQIFAADATDDCYVVETNWQHAFYYSKYTLMQSVLPMRGFMKVQTALSMNGNGSAAEFCFGEHCEPGFDPYVAVAGIHIYSYGDGMLDFYSTENWNYLGDTTLYTGETLTGEFIHNWMTGKFESFKIYSTARTYLDLADIAGTTTYNDTPKKGYLKGVRSVGEDVRYTYYEAYQLTGTCGYLQCPRWAPTKYGMRPWY